MADSALILHTTPELCFYSGSRPSGYDVAWPRLTERPALQYVLRTAGGANGNATAVLDNGDGAITAELPNIPLRTRCTLLDENSETLFSGLITRIRPGSQMQLDMEAGYSLRFTDPVPLRTTAAWSSYTEIRALPQVYGRVRLHPIRYDATGKKWLIADHPILAVDAVELDGAQIETWSLLNTTDTAGEPVALLETLEQYDDPARIAVTVRAKPHPTDGTLMERPDVVLWDFLVNVCGMEDYTAADFDSLRSAAAGMAIGGVVDDPNITIQTWVDRIGQGGGLAWGQRVDGLAMLWPADPQTVLEPDHKLTLSNAPGLAAETDQADLATELELAYDWDPAAGDLRRVLRLSSAEAKETYGTIEKRIEAGWLHTPADALAYGTRWLQAHARQTWKITATRPTIDADPGDSIDIDHPLSPVTSAVITGITHRGALSAVTATAPYGSPPAVELLGDSSGVEPDPLTGQVYDYQDGYITLLITNDDLKVMPGARCTLDGTTTRIADAAGYVQFTAAPGAHTMVVEASGHETRTVPVYIP